MTQQQQFAQKVSELIAQSKSLAPTAKKHIIELLNEARKRIIGEIADTNPQSFSAAQLTLLKHQVDQALTEFGQSATKYVTATQAEAAKLGSSLVSQPLVTAGLDAMAMGQLSTSTLAIAQGYTADLITALSKSAAAEVNGVIQRAFLGGQQVSDIIDQIGKAMNNGQEFGGLFSKIGDKAVTVGVNEILRVQSMATQARLEDAASRHEDLKKIWVHIPAAKIPRVTHMLAAGQVKLINEPFEVMARLGLPAEKLMFPRDPNGSAENTINCHCLSTPYFDKESFMPAAKDILSALGISVSAEAA